MPFFKLPPIFYTKPTEPDFRVAYGPKPMQHIRIRTPHGTGPHPTLLVLHGGKWKSCYGAKQTEYLCADLTKLGGITTCNIEFRRLGHVGGGWPNTYKDILAAIDHIHENAEKWKVDRNLISILGHSSGAHLAFSLREAAKRLNHEPKFALHTMIALAGVFDLDAAAGLQPEIDLFFGNNPTISPIKLLPQNIKQLILCGSRDKLTTQAAAYYTAARIAGDDIANITIDNCSHFTIIDPTASHWPVIRSQILSTITQ